MKIHVSLSDLEQFMRDLVTADELAEGDSNDAEIEHLQDLRDQAMWMLGIVQDEDKGYKLRTGPPQW